MFRRLRIVGLDQNGELMIEAADVDGGSIDNCGIANLSLDMSDFDCNDTGANTMMLMVVDDLAKTQSLFMFSVFAP